MNIDVNQALTILKQYSGIELKIINSQEEKETLQSALKLIVNLSDYQNLGICASTTKEAFDTLKNYLYAFGYSQDIAINSSLENKPVYLKFSTERMSYNLSDYQGEYRGVLITIFADFDDKIIGTYGHLPIDLFD
jgi:DNA polymerase III delta prime subunit